MFDANNPPTNALIKPAPLRDHFNGLKALFDAIPARPEGPMEPEGPAGAQGPAGSTGPVGPQGPPGEVTQTGLNNAVQDMLGQSSNITNGVSTLAIAISAPPTHSEVRQIVSKIDELTNAVSA